MVNFIISFILFVTATNFILAQKNSCKKLIGSYKFDSDVESKNTDVWKGTTTGFVFFQADYDLDMDGSPRAYHENDIGIENAVNGKKDGKWSPNVIVCDSDGNPVKQGPNDLNPGYYISKTTLEIDTTNYSVSNYRRYVNSENIPFLVLPGCSNKKIIEGKDTCLMYEYSKFGVKLGNIGLVVNLKSKESCFAIFADEGPSTIIGEGSIYLAKEIGLKIDTNRNGKGKYEINVVNETILYIVFPNSGLEYYDKLSIELIDKIGKEQVSKFGGKQNVIDSVISCLNKN